MQIVVFPLLIQSIVKYKCQEKEDESYEDFHEKNTRRKENS